MAEMVPGGFDSGPEFRTLHSVSVAARVAAELGADWVKTSYAPGFEQVVATCYVPVVVLGGPGQADPRATLEMVRAGMDAGAVGRDRGPQHLEGGGSSRHGRRAAGNHPRGCDGRGCAGVEVRRPGIGFGMSSSDAAACLRPLRALISDLDGTLLAGNRAQPDLLRFLDFLRRRRDRADRRHQQHGADAGAVQPKAGRGRRRMCRRSRS